MASDLTRPLGCAPAAPILVPPLLDRGQPREQVTHLSALQLLSWPLLAGAAAVARAANNR